MISLVPGGDPVAPLKLLCVGAHPDDIEIGCGGTVLRLLAERPGSTVRWVVFSGDAERRREAEQSAERFLADAAGRAVDVHGIRDAHFPAAESQIKELLQDVRSTFRPDIILTHHLEDRHQDHRVLAHATWQGFRDHLILEYEIPKWDGDIGNPNCYVPLDAETRDRKVRLILDIFASQRQKGWFTAETFEGLMRIRGIESGSPQGYAEAFHVRKAVLSLAAEPSCGA